MIKSLLNIGLSALAAAGILWIGGSTLPTASLVSATPALAPSSQIVRNTLKDEPIELAGGTYRMIMAEIHVEPGAETAVHIHPGPSIGFVSQGRLAITQADSGRATSFAAGSPLDHPWDRPHVMKNNGDTPATLLSFELNPIVN